MMYWYDHDMSWWGYSGMGIGMVLFSVLIIVGIVALVEFIVGGQQNGRPALREMSSPEQVLAARFARGEIGETEYRERLAVLRNDVPQ